MGWNGNMSCIVCLVKSKMICDMKLTNLQTMEDDSLRIRLDLFSFTTTPQDKGCHLYLLSGHNICSDIRVETSYYASCLQNILTRVEQ